MKNIMKYLAVLLTLFIGLSSCKDSLELSPISSISDANFWSTPDQYEAFVSGIHSRLRSHTLAFQLLGEVRSDIFGTEPGNAGTFSGEATQGIERLWQQALDLDNPGVSNFGGFYTNIGQLNLLINKVESATNITDANKAYYLGIGYGLRAFYYFHLVKTWGDVIIQTEPVVSFDISNLSKPATPASEVMNLINTDINNSLQAFGNNFSFRNQKGYWSRAATLMLKAEYNLWKAHRDGGNSAANEALNALNEIETGVPGLNLIPSYADVFKAGVSNKGNNEIIFSIRYLLNEAVMPFSGTFYPQTNLISNYWDSLENRRFDVNRDNWGGLLRAPVKSETFRRFNDMDSRKRFSIQAAYNSPSPGVFTIAGCFVKKYEGEQEQGVRRITNDFPIYRFADLLLMKAEAKIILGQDPSTEINRVRQRAYGANYNPSVHGFPNQNGDSNAKDALLEERLFEFVFEGKRWYDLRRFGDQFVFKYTPIDQTSAYKLLWPIDRNSLINNRDLKQNPGYPTF